MNTSTQRADLLERFSNGFSRERDVECGDLSPLSVIAAKKRRQVAALQKLNANEIRSRAKVDSLRRARRIGQVAGVKSNSRVVSCATRLLR
jgi:hypothetical protein